VVDNFGDAGVTYRLANAIIKKLPDAEIRLFTNGLEAFHALNSGIRPDMQIQKVNGIEFYSYDTLTEGFMEGYEIPKLVIEAFACHIPAAYYEKALDSDCLIINLDHLSAEDWIEGVHLKESLTGRKAKKYFFMPGFTELSGGIILGRSFSEEEIRSAREELCRFFKLDGDGLIGTIFTYEHDFTGFFSDILSSGRKVELIVFGEKSRKSFEPFINLQNEKIRIIFSDFISQEKYDDLLKTTDFNFVRGEDSWARACLSGKPFVWQSYFQKDNYQLVKVGAFNKYLERFYKDTKIFSEFSNYQTAFNDRSPQAKDNSLLFFLKHLETIESYNNELSKYLFKNCNLIKNLLFFAGSLKEL